MWVSGWVDQKLVRRPGWTRGGLANTDSLYRKDYTQTVGKVQSGIKWNYWHERRRCSPSQLANDWQWRIYSSLQYGHCGQSWLSSTTLRINSVFRQRACLHMWLSERVSEWVSWWVGEWSANFSDQLIYSLPTVPLVSRLSTLRKTKNEKQKMKNEKWKMKNEKQKWKTKNEKLKVKNENKKIKNKN